MWNPPTQYLFLLSLRFMDPLERHLKELWHFAAYYSLNMLNCNYNLPSSLELADPHIICLHSTKILSN